MKKVVLLLIVVAVAIGFAGSTQVHAKGKKIASGYKSYKGGKTIDGDTFRYRGKRYRIQQYNATEIGQPGSRKATLYLQKKLDSGNYKWKPVAKDVYGRTIVKLPFRVNSEPQIVVMESKATPIYRGIT